MNMIAFILAATLSAGNAEFDSTARDGARDISLSRAREELREKGPAPGALEKAMLADPKKFEKPAEAEALCRGVFADELRAQFAAKARAIDERLGIGSNSVGVDPNSTLSDSNSTLNDPNTTLKDSISPLIDEIANKHFAAAFAAERKAAVEAQAKTIVAATRPTEAEFDAKEDWELREQMQKRIIDEQKPVHQRAYGGASHKRRPPRAEAPIRVPDARAVRHCRAFEARRRPKGAARGKREGAPRKGGRSVEGVGRFRRDIREVSRARSRAPHTRSPRKEDGSDKCRSGCRFDLEGDRGGAAEAREAGGERKGLCDPLFCGTSRQGSRRNLQRRAAVGARRTAGIPCLASWR